ncbi:MAG: hypothetical protein WC511_02015 [Candidatus Pacearchaeota archaeon]
MFQYLFILVAIKALTIGSSFNFYYWWKYGHKYTSWYFSETRNTFMGDKQ